MKVTKVTLHADAALCMDYQKFSTGITMEVELNEKETVEKLMESFLPALREQALNEAKAGIYRARKIAAKGNK